MIKMKKAILCIFMCLVLMLSFAACKNKDGGSDTTAPAENTAEDTTSSLEDIINALNGVDTTDSSNPASTTEATEPETMPKGPEIKDNGAKKDIKTIKCYFSGDDLVKMEILSSQGVLVCNDIKFSSKVDESLFKVPAGYTDISTLYGSNGQFTGFSK